MKKYLGLQLIGLSILTMMVLVLISFIEVAVYSYLINTGETESFYEAHANLTAPYISGIFGFIIFFGVIRYHKKRNNINLLKWAILFPTVYILLDVTLISLAGVSWGEYFYVFLLANLAKASGSLLAYKL